MDPAPSDPAEHVRLLRQQLLLAQVRLMEIEDDRDATAARLAEVEALLSAAQRLADAKLDEAAHLARTLTDLQTAQQGLVIATEEKERMLQDARDSLSATQRDLANERSLRCALEARVERLVAEIATMKASRSWRSTAWLRAIENSIDRK